MVGQKADRLEYMLAVQMEIWKVEKKELRRVH